MAKYSRFAVDFDGTSFADAGDVLDKSHLDAFSLVAWARSQDQADAIVSKMDGGGVGYRMGMDSDRLAFTREDAGGGVDHIFSLAPVTGTNGFWWNQYVVTCSGGLGAATMKLYCNGVLIPHTTSTDTLAATISNTGLLTLAGENGAGGWGFAGVGDGMLDGVAVYDGELDAAEVLALYAKREPVDYALISTVASLESFWRMGDGDTHPTLTDSVGSNDMTLAGGSVAADIREFYAAGGWPLTGGSGGIRNVGGVPTTTFFDMYGIDNQCAPGTAPTVWTVSGSPDPTGAQAPGFPCGGPWDHIWIGRTYDVVG